MAQFDVQWLDAGGALARQRVEAHDAAAIAARLGVPVHRVLSVASVREAEAGTAIVRWGRERFPLRLFSQELSVLLGAGIPLLEAVTTLREKEGAASTATALAAVEDRLRAGEAFSTALRASPRVFDELYVAVVSSAERTGQLREALKSHAAYLAWVETLRARLVAASVYPLLLVGAGSAVVLFLLAYVVPRFAGLFEEVQGDVPAASRALLSLGQWTGAHPLLAAAMLLVALALPWLACQQPALRERIAAALWSVPGLGERLRLLALARLYRTLSMLLEAGVPALPALRTARPVVAAPLRSAVDAVAARVERGERFSQALEGEALSTPVALRMLRVGERSGRIGAMLGEAAAFYDEELARLTEIVTRLLNPLLMLLMGGLIGTVVVLMYLPIFQLMESVQ